MHMSDHRNWDVLLLGGGGGVGKTEAAQRLAQVYSSPISVLQADDVRLVLQRAIPASNTPELHFFLDADIMRLDLDVAVQRQLAIGRYVSDKLEIVMRHHVETGYAVIIEGDSILPSLAARTDLPEMDGVRAVFIEERDLEAVRSAMATRARGAVSTEELDRWARFHLAHGNVLVEEARALGLPVVQARPKTDLVARIRDAAR
jgi:2-phosphoglycerate kinase